MAERTVLEADLYATVNVSTRELKSLIREGTQTTSSRLRSGESCQLPQDTVITMENETVGSQDLQQQLAEAVAIGAS